MDRVLRIALHILYCTYSVHMLLFFWPQLPVSVVRLRRSGGERKSAKLPNIYVRKTQNAFRRSCGSGVPSHGSLSLFFWKKNLIICGPGFSFFLLKTGIPPLTLLHLVQICVLVCDYHAHLWWHDPFNQWLHDSVPMAGRSSSELSRLLATFQTPNSCGELFVFHQHLEMKFRCLSLVLTWH